MMRNAVRAVLPPHIRWFAQRTGQRQQGCPRGRTSRHGSPVNLRVTDYHGHCALARRLLVVGHQRDGRSEREGA